MVFHEIDSITEVFSGHRVIIYYIRSNQSKKNDKLFQITETVLESLDKKNDDLLLIKILNPSTQLIQFKELYKPEVAENITLFAINNEGIPLISEHIGKENDICSKMESICTFCNLNQVPSSEITKLCTPQNGPKHQETLNEEHCSTTISDNHFATGTKESSPSLPLNGLDNGIKLPDPLFTELQIRLPSGTQGKQKFSKDAGLQEVRAFIREKYQIKDFDLKTYNHQPFSEEEYVKSLHDLDLYPNGVIIVVNKNIVPFNNNRGFSGIIQYGVSVVIAKTNSVFLYVQNLLLIFWNSFFNSSGNNGGGQPGGRSFKPSQGSESGHSSSGRGGSSRPKANSNRFGNIHTLRRNDDSDDENNRYNGNSTQQK